MPLGGETLIVGQYAVTWNGIALGLMEGEEGVPTLIQRIKSKPINSSDKWGDMLIDAIRRGVDYDVEMVCMEYTKGVQALWPFGTFGNIVTPFGTLHYALSAALVMTALGGTPAASSPATLTANKALIAMDHEARMQFGPQVRNVPLRLNLFPYDKGGAVYGHFTTA